MAKEKEVDKEVKVSESKETYTLRSVPTQHTNVIYNENDETILSEQQALVLILNEIQSIKRLLG